MDSSPSFLVTLIHSNDCSSAKNPLTVPSNVKRQTRYMRHFRMDPRLTAQLSPLPLSYFILQSHWAPCSTLKVPCSFSYMLLILWKHPCPSPLTPAPISHSLPLICPINIHLSKCQEIVSDLCCWLLLHFELTFIIACMLKCNYVPSTFMAYSRNSCVSCVSST